MKGIWGSHEERNNGSSDCASARNSINNERDSALPNEHTRLLPNRVESATYLSPDDPAVSPYNLWSIRVTRYFTILLTLIAFAWWIILLVSTFITPPGFYTRGSGFFPFSYASLALANLLFTLVFFAVPSRAVRIASIAISILLLINVIILISVQQTRYEEGWVGIASVLWAFVTAIWTLSTDRLVEWGKYEEEERLTGRAETRRTVGEWLAVLVSTIFMVILAIVVFFMGCTLFLRALDAGLEAPGKRYWVDGNKYKLHVYCHGNHTDNKGAKLPTVLLEGGEGPVEDGLWDFANNAIMNGSISRYCFVDRPGFAWSDAAPSPLSAGMAVEAVDEALTRAGEEGPWVFMSAGIGSIYSRILSSRHGKNIKGLLLIDPLHEEFLNDVGTSRRGFLLWFRGIISPLGIDRVPGAVFRGRTKEDRVFGRAAYQTGKYIFAKLQENLVADTLSKRDVASSRAIQAKGVPLTLVSSGIQIRQDSKWEEKQRDLSNLTRNLQHWDIVNNAPHQVWRTSEGRNIIEKRLRQLVHG
ncbi:mitochondrial integral membrane protein [Xylaria bambusicola]|uniref:mitochondrial integral membrane protein n=1 Tax=Xylaria bambusicola TaxID=326684 RepID=UPI00200777EA|nr:mitochondrial integral membrane protein [Xylaria bambusicola]KAI0508405.1 mitochondrial integral membrane protein [Xylaria bambusicola]